MDKNNFKLSDGNVWSLMLNSPQLPTKDNLWKYEVWEVKDKDGNILYHKNKTFENCWLKYGIMVPSTRGAFNSEGLYTSATIYKCTLDRTKYNYSLTDLRIPVVKEITDRVPNFLCCQNPNDTAPLVTFWNRNIPDNETNRKLFKAIRDYFKDVPIGFSCNSLFGCYNSFSPHWAWASQVQRLWGANTDWKITIAGKPGSLKSSGVSLWGMFANTDLKSINIEFASGAITNMNNLFSSVKNDNWGTLDVTVSYKSTLAKQHPYLEQHEEYTNALGFIPLQLIKTFRACQITQEGLDNIFHNSILSQLTDITGAFAEHLRCRARVFPHAYGCQPFEETPNNTIQVSRPNNTNRMFSDVTDTVSNTPNYTGGGALEAFYDSGIEEVQPILDMYYVHNPSHIYNMFTSWRGSDNEGTRTMKRVRLKNIGNLPVWDFNNSNGQGNNGTDFDEASVKYLFQHLRDQTKYREITEAERQAGKTQEDINNITHCNRATCKLYCPNSWRPFINDDMVTLAQSRGWEVYVDNLKYVVIPMPEH